MASDNSNNNNNNNNPNDMNPRRRGSVTQQALAGLFRSNSTSTSNNFQNGDTQRRRLSISTTGLGLAGTSATNPGAFGSGYRRGSMSTNSDSIEECAIDEDELSRTAPTTPFVRRMSFGGPTMRTTIRNGNGSPGSSLNDQGFNWSEQLRSRAESSVQGPRPSFSFGSSMSTSPPRGNGYQPTASNHHDRAKSVSDMPVPPAQAPTAAPRAPEPSRPKPDAFQERILKGDFYMD